MRSSLYAARSVTVKAKAEKGFLLWQTECKLGGTRCRGYDGV